MRKDSSTGTTIYAYDGSDLITEYTSSGVIAVRYTHGAWIDEPLAMLRDGAVSYYEADGIGSITSLTDAAGAAVAAYRTDVFGNSVQTAGSIVNPFQYTGREWDSDIDLYFYRARYYDPSVGRFLSEDPIRFSSGATDFYAYVGNNPVLFVDSLGLCSEKPDRLKCANEAAKQASIGGNIVVDANEMTEKVLNFLDDPSTKSALDILHD